MVKPELCRAPSNLDQTHPTIRSRGDDYHVHLDPGGDHIVTKHNKRDPLHGWPVERETATWVRVVDLATAAREL